MNVKLARYYMTGNIRYCIAGNFRGRKFFVDLTVKVCEIVFAIVIFAISNEPAFEFLLE